MGKADDRTDEHAAAAQQLRRAPHVVRLDADRRDLITRRERAAGLELAVALAHALLPGAAVGFLVAGFSVPAMSLGSFAVALLVDGVGAVSTVDSTTTESIGAVTPEHLPTVITTVATFEVAPFPSTTK